MAFIVTEVLIAEGRITADEKSVHCCACKKAFSYAETYRDGHGVWCPDGGCSIHSGADFGPGVRCCDDFKRWCEEPSST